MRDHCIFDLIPHDFLLKFCEIKNQITKEIIENYEEPTNYQHLDDAHRLLHKIKKPEVKPLISRLSAPVSEHQRQTENFQSL